MKYDILTALKNLDGTDAQEGDEVATVKKGLETALITDTKELTGAQKLARFKLLQKILKAKDTVELSSEEIAVAKTAAEIYPTLVYGQIDQFLEQTI